MTKKTYKANSSISVNVSVTEFISATVKFESQTDGTSVFVTTDADLQAALEGHYNFGKLFKLIKSELTLTEYTYPKVTYTNIEDSYTVSDETAARKKADNQIVLDSITSAEYDSVSSVIKFKNKGGTVVSSVDAEPFIVDGMVSSVVIFDGYLVITFNTDSGKQPISIPLTDIFNPNNYYTKSEVDAMNYAVITDEEMDDVLEENTESEETGTL